MEQAQEREIAKNYLNLRRRRERYRGEYGLSETDFECVLALGSRGFTSETDSKSRLAYEATERLKGMTNRDIAFILLCGESTVSYALTGLVKKGYVIRLDRKNCRRISKLKEAFLSRSGSELYHQAVCALNSSEPKSPDGEIDFD